MAGQINYRPINAPSFHGVNQGMNNAANTINNGAALLTKALKGVQDQRIEQYNMQRDANTNEILNAISGQNTLDGLAQATKQGLFDTSRFNGAVDQAKIDEALRNQDNIIRKEITETNAFNESERKRKDAPLMGQFGSALRGAKSMDEVNGIIEQARQAGVSEQGLNTLAQTGQANFRDNWRFGNETKDRAEKDRGVAIADANAGVLTQLANLSGEMNANDFNDVIERHIADNGLRAGEAAQLRTEANNIYKNATSLNADNALTYATRQAALAKELERAERDNPTTGWTSEYAPDEDHTSAFRNELKEKYGNASWFHDDDGDAWFGSNWAGGSGLQQQVDKHIADVTDEFAKETGRDDFKIPGPVLRRALSQTQSETEGLLHQPRLNADDFKVQLGKAMTDWLDYNRNRGTLDNLEDQSATELSTLRNNLLNQQREYFKGR